MDISQHVFPFNQVNDVEFKCMFPEVQYDITNNDMDFDMLSTRLDTDENGSLNDIDPDDNFFTSNNPIEYWLPVDFKVSQDLTNNYKYKFSILHFNSRSLNKNSDAIDQFISQLNLKFSIYGFSETWIHDNKMLLINRDGYTFYHNDRRGRKGGGVALLVNDLCDAKVRDDIYLPETLCEYLFIEIILDNSKNIIVGIIYRDLNKPICDFNENYECFS